MDLYLVLDTEPHQPSYFNIYNVSLQCRARNREHKGDFANLRHSILCFTEFSGIAAGWSNVREHVTFAEDFTMLCMMLLLFFDAFLYMVVALYIDAIFPSKYGIPKPWYFPLKVIYMWVSSGRKALILRCIIYI